MANSFLEYRGSFSQINDLEIEMILSQVIKLARAEAHNNAHLESFCKHCEDKLAVTGNGILSIDFDRYLLDEPTRLKVLEYLSQIGQRLCLFGEVTPSEWRQEVWPDAAEGETSTWVWLRTVSQLRALLSPPFQGGQPREV